jgi:N-acetylmuramoyl-L-alanine amidase CwlA
MGIIAAAVRELIAAGVQEEALITAIERLEAVKFQPLSGAERTQRWRENRNVTLVTNVTATSQKSQKSQKSPPSQRTPTLLREDIKIKKESRSSLRRASRLPVDWQPSEVDRQFAASKGLPRERLAIEAEKFRNYWIAKSGSAATKTDWPATWRNWVLTSLERVSGAVIRPSTTNKEPVWMKPPPGCRSEEEILADYRGSTNGS